MREVVVKHEVYKFSELSEGAQDKALEQLSDINVDYDWWDSVIWGLSEQIKEHCGIWFDDKGVAFDLDRANYLYFSKGHIGIENSGKLVEALIKGMVMSDKEKKYLRENADELYIDVSHYGGGSGANHLLLQYTANDVIDEGTQDAINEWFDENVIDEVLSALKKEYNYATSRKAIIETIEANDYDFLKNGKLFG